MGRKRKRYACRGIGLLLAVAPVALLVASLVSALTGVDEDHPIGLTVMLLALVLAAHNAYLTFLRERLYYRRKGSLDGYRRVSVAPAIGTVLIVLGALLGFGSAICASLGLVAVLLDTGGLPWFVLCTWNDSLWDQPSGAPPARRRG